MKNMFAIVAAVAFAASAFGQSQFDTAVNVRQAEAITAKAATVETVPNGVAVFLEDPAAERSAGLIIDVKSSAKFVVVRATLADSTTQIRVNRLSSGGWYLLGKPGRYAITIVESDPERGIAFTDVDASIIDRGTPTEPDEPPEETKPRPPVGGLQKVTQVTTASATALGDPTTAAKLAVAYREALEAMATEKSVDVCKSIASEKRRAVMRARDDAALKVDWYQCLVSIDVELAKFTTNAADYRAALKAVVTGLEAVK